MNHPFVAVWMAFDPDSKKAYVYDTYSRIAKKGEEAIATYASALRRHGDHIPVIWPHDMNKKEPKSGQLIQQLFVEEGVNMFRKHFTNPPREGMKDGTGAFAVGAGIMAITKAMHGDAFKVFSNLEPWFQEFRNYNTMDGEIVKINDDHMDATRYAFMSRRHAKSGMDVHPTLNFENQYTGTAGGWMGT